ncbi:MAG: N-acetylmuramoyl-L-alanine amidase [Deltaproteobacteria bacterium]|nr:N-acetylmuramoyl-L-alanine amidase [Deltaproteobacteria bacterium]
MCTWLLDNGHGGVLNGLYQTKGKRSPVWPDGSVLYEGEFTRAIVARLAELLTEAGIKYVVLTPEQTDVGLSERVRRANEWGDAALVSIHANAGGGHGYEVFTSPGVTASDKMADIFLNAFAEEFPDERMRADNTDGDLDKEADFAIISRTHMPAVLTECFFMDNEAECRTYLMTKEGRDRIANAHFNAIIEIEKEDLS